MSEKIELQSCSGQNADKAAGLIELKKELAWRFPSDLDSCTQGKSNFIRNGIDG